MIREVLKDYVLIVAAPGESAETARGLLAHADSPAQVRAQGSNEFLVPTSVADAYYASLRPKPRRRTKKEESENGD